MQGDPFVLGIVGAEEGRKKMIAEPVREFIFLNDRPFRSCHASTVLKLSNGDILVAWFGGSKEGAEDVAIWYTRRTEDGWDYPKKLSHEAGLPHWNPVLFMGENGQIILYYKVGHRISQWYTCFMTSEDGYFWSSPRPLVEGDRGGRGPVRNKVIKLKDGTWLAPASIEGKSWDAFVDISRDQGKTWIKSAMVPIVHQEPERRGKEAGSDPASSLDSQYVFHGKGVIQPTLWESDPGAVHMLLRSTEGRIFRSDSADSGKTWCPAYPTVLPNNNSGIDVVKLSDGRLILAYNPVGRNRGPRTPLILSMSRDNGITWKQVWTLEEEEGEYSYPAIIADEDEILVTYTWKRERIVLWKIPISSL